jgi:hypothetical protein
MNYLMAGGAQGDEVVLRVRPAVTAINDVVDL